MTPALSPALARGILIALALAARAAARDPLPASLQQAQDNFQALAEMHFGGPVGTGALTRRFSSGKEARLTLERVDLETVHPIAPGRFAALAVVKDSAGGKINARIVADLTGTNWHVESVKLVNSRGAVDLRAEAARRRDQAKSAAASTGGGGGGDSAGLTAESPRPRPAPRQTPHGAIPDVTLKTLADNDVALASCRTPKCLTVYVAPWCGYCVRATQDIRALRDYLKTRGIDTRIIVGRDSMPAIEPYARAFGWDTLVDPEGLLPVRGVPNFMVSEPGGAILQRTAGAPASLPNPAEAAADLGL